MSVTADFIYRIALPRRLWFVGGGLLLLLAVLPLVLLDTRGMSRQTIGYLFLALTLLLYAVIGLANRTNDAHDYYVAGRRVPALYNGMATAADWMSAASFMGIAGSIYLQGYGGLAFVMGWTGGYVLIAVFLAPYLRRAGHWTVADFLGARYGGHVPRLIAAAITVACSFTYLVAQIYGVGLVTTWLTGVDFTVGIYLGLTGVLVCSFLGGMQAVTWTQVAQYLVLIVAYLVPVFWLGFQATGSLMPQLVYGQGIERVTRAEARLAQDPREQAVKALLAARAFDPAAIAVDDRDTALPLQMQPMRDPDRTARAMAALPHAEPFVAADAAAEAVKRRNFLALVFCLMVGTAAMPHILVRFNTTPSVAQTRSSVGWALLMIVALYISAPALAVFVKLLVLDSLVGAGYVDLPAWVHAWQRVDPGLMVIEDVNRDGLVQLGEIRFSPEIVTLVTPEIAGLPYVVTGLVAAGAMAAALSTADGLLLTIASALSHDVYFRTLDPQAPGGRRVLISKCVLLVVAVLAGLVAGTRPGGVLELVVAAFSLAAAGFFPALLLGIFWQRATGLAAVCGMLAGFGVTFYYLAITHPWLRHLFGVSQPVAQARWWDIDAAAAGLFGVPLGFAVIVVVSLLTPMPVAATRQLVLRIRTPEVV